MYMCPPLVGFHAYTCGDRRTSKDDVRNVIYKFNLVGFGRRSIRMAAPWLLLLSRQDSEKLPLFVTMNGSRKDSKY